MKSKWTSRKFWLAIVGQVVGIVTLVSGAAAAQQVEAIAGAIIIVAVALGYLHNEAKVDAEREKTKRE